jgi:hypothetical protein
VTTGGIGADGAMLETLLARALRRSGELEDLSRELVDVAEHLRGWSSRIPVAVGGWHSLSARAYTDAAERLRTRTGWVIQALVDELAGVRAEIARLEEQCERLRYEILLRSVSAVPG